MTPVVLDPCVRRCVLEAEAKVLATSDGERPNAVPVSYVRIVEEKIWLVDLFMDKTASNLRRNPRVSLVCWKGTAGYQIKGRAELVVSGPLFDEAGNWVASTHPDRKVKGLILLTPEEIFDIAPAKDSRERLGAV